MNIGNILIFCHLTFKKCVYFIYKMMPLFLIAFIKCSAFLFFRAKYDADYKYINRFFPLPSYLVTYKVDNCLIILRLYQVQSFI